MTCFHARSFHQNSKFFFANRRKFDGSDFKVSHSLSRQLFLMFAVFRLSNRYNKWLYISVIFKIFNCFRVAATLVMKSASNYQIFCLVLAEMLTIIKFN